MKVGGKVFVVTGGGSGVGRELTLQLLARGARVAAVDISPKGLEETARLAGERGGLSTHVMDVADKEAVQRLTGEVIAAHGAVDGLINNAGIIHPFLGVQEMGYELIGRTMRINFGGTLYMTKAFLPLLLERPQAHITNVSSMGALYPIPGQGIYGVSKAGVRLLTESLRAELGGTNVRVMAVFPGGINSGIMDNSGVKTSERMERLRKVFRLLSPKKAAAILIRGIEHNRSRLTPGMDATLTDFACRMSPVLAPRLIYWVMKLVVLE